MTNVFKKINFVIKFSFVNEIDSPPPSQLSDMYQNIISATCKKPSHVVQNSLDFVNQIKKIKVTKNHIMASFDVESMFNSIIYCKIFPGSRFKGKNEN